MRLTPSWLRSSSDTPPDECSEDGETPSEPRMTIYHDPGDDSSANEAGADGRADAFIPETDDALLSVLEDMQLPVTVDEVTDRLIEPARPPIKTWAAVHERLHRTRLPALDDADEIEFDDAQGIVDRSEPRSDDGGLLSPAAYGTVLIIVLLAALTAVSVSLVTALTVTLVATTVAWFAPNFD